MTTIDGTQQGAAAITGADRAIAPPPADNPNAWFRRGWKLRCSLTLTAIAFLTLFVIVPAANVFTQALKNGWGAYVAVFYPTVNQARIDEIQEKLRSPSKTPLLERRKLSKELSELQAPIDRAKKNWSAIRMTLGVAAIVLPMNLIFGIAAAWAVTKYRFKGRSFLVSLIDLPFSVSPVISGLVFVLIFGAQGFLAGWSRSDRALWLVPAVRAIPWLVLAIALVWAWRRLSQWVNPAFPGVHSRRAKWIALAVAILAMLVWKYVATPERSWAFLLPTDWKWPVPTSLYWRGFSGEHSWPIGASEFAQGVIFTPLAIVLASIFVTFPFVARSLVPLMEAQGVEAEQAAISLGAGGWYTFRRVTLPSIKWGLLYGVILCSARAFGEFGAVSVVSGHLDANDTMPLRVEKLWQEYKTQAAFTVASLLAMLAVVTLVLKTIIEWKTRQETEDENAGPKTVLGGARH